jgi:hypothetical protein
MGCLGGTGVVFGDRGLRVGGDLSLCQGRRGVSLTRGGANVGFRTLGQRVYWTTYAGIGVGTFRDKTPVTGAFRSAFGYLEPTTALGLVTRTGAVEVGFQSLAMIHGVQWVGTGPARGVLQLSVGAHVRAMFGRFGMSRRAAVVEDVSMPLAVPAGTLPPPLPPEYASPIDEQAVIDMPLAVPVDEVADASEPDRGPLQQPPADAQASSADDASPADDATSPPAGESGSSADQGESSDKAELHGPSADERP